jgi:hypothetical protein
MGRRVRAITEGLSWLFAGNTHQPGALGVRLVPARCGCCEDWMVVCEGEPDLAPVELRPGPCPTCRESAFEARPLVAAGGH